MNCFVCYCFCVFFSKIKNKIFENYSVYVVFNLLTEISSVCYFLHFSHDESILSQLRVKFKTYILKYILHLINYN